MLRSRVMTGERRRSHSQEYNLTTPYSCRSSPVQLDPREFAGFVAKDVDGDGKCLMMRQRDAAGPYKPSTLDPRIMVRREPHERGGDYYRLWPEGLVRALLWEERETGEWVGSPKQRRLRPSVQPTATQLASPSL